MLQKFSNNRHYFAQLWTQRISAGSEQFGISQPTLQQALVRDNILLNRFDFFVVDKIFDIQYSKTNMYYAQNRKVLADLAIWEPQTFETIVRIARERAVQDDLEGVRERHTTDNRVFMAKGGDDK